MARKVIALQEQGRAPWSIAKRLGVRVGVVEHCIARERLRQQVESGRLTIRQATSEEMAEFQRARERHDRRRLVERDRAAEVGRYAA